MRCRRSPGPHTDLDSVRLDPMAAGGPQAMGHDEASRPLHDQVQAVRTSFLAIVRGLEKSGHIVLSLLAAPTAAGCWAGLYWRTQSAPVMEAALVVTLLYTLLQVLDQKQAAALTCCGGWVLVNTLFLALTLSLSSDALAQKIEAVTAPSMQAAFAAFSWCAGMGLSVLPLAMRTRLISGVAGAGLFLAAFAVACHRLEGQVHKVSTVLVTLLLGLAWGAICVHVARRHGGRVHAVVLSLQQLGEQLNRWAAMWSTSKMAVVGGPQAMGHDEDSRPVHDHVQAAHTSFLAIVRGLEKAGHIVLGLLVAATAAGCWAGLYWRTQSAPAMAASVVVTLLYTLLHLLDQKQAAALTCRPSTTA